MMRNPSDKVKAATTVGGVAASAAAALATIIIWAFQHYTDTPVPEQVAVALPVVLGALFTVIGTYIAGYQTREDHPAPSAVAAVERRHTVRPPTYGVPAQPISPEPPGMPPIPPTR